VTFDLVSFESDLTGIQPCRSLSALTTVAIFKRLAVRSEETNG